MKIDFSPENKAKNDWEYPKLTLEHGERARIACIEAQPTLAFVHTLKAPQIINGEVVIKPKKQRDGSYKDEVEEDFVGRHLCFGNPNTLTDKQKDPTNCPTCAAANESDAIAGAQRAFAMHVLRYKTQPGGFKPITPFSADLIAWRFSDKVFNSLVDIMEEHGDLRQKDLNLGPCENKMYQKYDIQIGSDAFWLSDPEYTDYVKRLYAENKSEDLTPLIARKISRELAEEEIAKVHARHAIMNGTAGAGVATAAGVGSAMDLDSLLSSEQGQSENPPEWATGAAPADPDAALDTPASSEPEQAVELETTTTPDVPAPSSPEPQEPAADPAPAAKKSEPLDFTSLLDGL